VKYSETLFAALVAEGVNEREQEPLGLDHMPRYWVGSHTANDTSRVLYAHPHALAVRPSGAGVHFRLSLASEEKLSNERATCPNGMRVQRQCSEMVCLQRSPRDEGYALACQTTYRARRERTMNGRAQVTEERCAPLCHQCGNTRHVVLFWGRYWCVEHLVPLLRSLRRRPHSDG